ncbi:glycosyltransferase [Mariprofundus sp. NF]|nr:glycosyltransferase [Mariprofundus sp. NF]
MPVFNGEQLVRTALDSLLAQSFGDFELIISDNASTDGTEQVCREYAGRDERIRYVRQTTNIGASANFKVVLDEAHGEYFMWAACDDTRSPDFIDLNAKFLSENPEYVASTCPNGFDDRPLGQQKLINFALDGEKFDRFVQFFEHCWLSHGIFYSLIRTDVLRGCNMIGQSFIAADWAIDLYLASKGKVNRTKNGYEIFGVKGISRGSAAYSEFRNHVIEVLLPFFRLTKYVVNLTDDLSFKQRSRILLILMKLNLSVAFVQLRRTFFKS